MRARSSADSRKNAGNACTHRRAAHRLTQRNPRPSALALRTLRGIMHLARYSGAAALALVVLAGCKEPPAPEKTEPATATAPAAASSAPDAQADAGAAVRADAKTKPDIKCDNSPTATFHMPGLEADVRKKLAKKPDQPILMKELAGIKSINVSTSHVDYLDPCIFPKLTGMKDLFLGEGDIDDLSLLSSHAELVSLRASITKVKDLSPLSNLTKLDRLDLGRTPVRDLEPLSSLVNLTELELDGTDIDTVKPLASLVKLERLSIKNTRVGDVSPLAGLTKLKSLSVGGSPVSDFHALAGLVARGLKIDTK